MTWADDLTPREIGSRREYMHPAGVRVIFDHMHPTSRGIESWVEVRWQGNVPDPQLLTFGRFDLMGSTTADRLAKSAARVVKSVPEDGWGEIIRAAVYDTVREWLEGGEAVRLANVEESDAARWLLRPLIGGAGATSLVGAGGSHKSFVALAAGLSVAMNTTRFLGMRAMRHGPILYLDWEADAETHAERMRALLRGAEVAEVPDNVLYRAEKQPLWRSANRLEKIVAEFGAVLVIVDSVMLARGGDAFGPEETVRLYAGLRQLGVPALLVDHKSKESINKGRKGAYGSIVNENSARLVWEITDVAVHGPDDTSVRVEQHKRNNTRKLGDIGLRISFTNKEDRLVAVSIGQINPATVVPMPENATSLADAIHGYLLMKGPEGADTTELSDKLKKPANQIRARLSTLQSEDLAEKRMGRWYGLGEWRADDQKELVDPF